MSEHDDHSFMQVAMEEARLAADRDEVPIGAVIVDSARNEILARCGNRTIELADPTAHAEILAIREACKITGKQRVPDFDLYVTLEPCTMCAAAIAFARIRKIIFATPDPKGGGILHGAKFFNQPTCHHKIKVENGILENEAAELLKNYFRNKRF
jgi:tRNA(Arg) A34 adenosine deaminase TadA